MPEQDFGVDCLPAPVQTLATGRFWIRVFRADAGIPAIQTLGIPSSVFASFGVHIHAAPEHRKEESDHVFGDPWKLDPGFLIRICIRG